MYIYMYVYIYTYIQIYLLTITCMVHRFSNLGYKSMEAAPCDLASPPFEAIPIHALSPISAAQQPRLQGLSAAPNTKSRGLSS